MTQVIRFLSRSGYTRRLLNFELAAMKKRLTSTAFGKEIWLILLLMMAAPASYAADPLAAISVSTESRSSGIYRLDARRSRDSDGSITQYRFEVEGRGGIAYSYTQVTTENAITVQLPLNGSYYASVTVTDDDGGTDTSSRYPILVYALEDLTPSADFSGSAREGDEYLTVDFTFTGSKGNDPAEITWTFPGGSNSSGETASFTFPSAGTHNVALSVVDVDGDSSQFSQLITLVEPEPDNRPPSAANDSASTDHNTVELINVLGNDSDPDGDSLTITSVSTADNGSVVVTGDSVRYTPNNGFSGNDSFTYIISDGELTDSARVTVTVAAEETVDPVDENRAPIGNRDSFSVVSGASIELDLLRNDSDPDRDTLIVTTFTQPQSGTVSKIAGGKLGYSSDTGFVGKVSFSYTISDGNLESESIAVVITVTSADAALKAPVADISTSNYVDAGSQNILLDGSDSSDPEGGNLSYEWVQNPGEPRLTLRDAQSAIANFDAPLVEQAAIVTFALTVTDPDGLTDTAEATVQIGFVDAPVVVVDTPPKTVPEGSTVTLSGRGFFKGEEVQSGLFWRQVDNGAPAVGTSDVESNAITFVTPSVAAEAELELEFELLLQSDLGVEPSDSVVITVQDNGISDAAFPADYVTTKAADVGDTPFGIKASLGSLIRLEPSKIPSASVRTDRPRKTPLELITTQIVTSDAGTAELIFKLKEPLPTDYTWFVYQDYFDEAAQQQITRWTPFADVESGERLAINAARDEVTLTLQDFQSQQPRMADSNGEAGVITLVSGPGQITDWTEGSATVGGGALGVTSALLLLLLGVMRKFRTGFASAVVGLAFLGAGATVKAADLEYFAGVSFGNLTMEDNAGQVEKKLEAGNGPEASIDLDGASSIVKAYAGAFFSKNIGFRLAYIDLGEADVKIGAGLAAGEEQDFAQQVFDALPNTGTGVALSLQGRFPLTEKLTLHDWGGIFMWDNDVVLNLNNQTISSSRSGTDILLGAALEYQLIDNLGLRLEFERYNQDGSGITMLGLGAAYYF